MEKTCGLMLEQANAFYQEDCDQNKRASTMISEKALNNQVVTENPEMTIVDRTVVYQSVIVQNEKILIPKMPPEAHGVASMQKHSSGELEMSQGSNISDMELGSQESDSKMDIASQESIESKMDISSQESPFTKSEGDSDELEVKANSTPVANLKSTKIAKKSILKPHSQKRKSDVIVDDNSVSFPESHFRRVKDLPRHKSVDDFCLSQKYSDKKIAKDNVVRKKVKFNT